MSLNPNKLVIIGSSTGGPGLIEYIVEKLKHINGSVIIAQHMDRLPLESFASRLGRIGDIDVVCAKGKKTVIENHKIYVLHDTSIINKDQNGRLYIEKSSGMGYYHPSIDHLLSSIALLDSLELLSIYILSGIGDDGTKGSLDVKNFLPRVKIIAQDEKSSKVYGMPRSIKEAGICDKVCSIEEIADEIEKDTL